MDKTNSKILTVSFALGAALIAFTLHLLIKIFANVVPLVRNLSASDLFTHGLPVAIGLILFLYFQFSRKIVAWGEEVVNEVRKVVWPTRKDTTAMTIVVIVMVAISSVIITTFDLISAQALSLLMK